jgi:hypothetical protein
MSMPASPKIRGKKYFQSYGGKDEEENSDASLKAVVCSCLIVCSTMYLTNSSHNCAVILENSENHPHFEDPFFLNTLFIATVKYRNKLTITESCCVFMFDRM